MGRRLLWKRRSGATAVPLSGVATHADLCFSDARVSDPPVLPWTTQLGAQSHQLLLLQATRSDDLDETVQLLCLWAVCID